MTKWKVQRSMFRRSWLKFTIPEPTTQCSFPETANCLSLLTKSLKKKVRWETNQDFLRFFQANSAVKEAIPKTRRSSRIVTALPNVNSVGDASANNNILLFPVKPCFEQGSADQKTELLVWSRSKLRQFEVKSKQKFAQALREPTSLAAALDLE